MQEIPILLMESGKTSHPMGGGASDFGDENSPKPSHKTYTRRNYDLRDRISRAELLRSGTNVMCLAPTSQVDQ